MAINWSKVLNKKQLEAVETTDKPLRIIAGAGTGKTRMLIHRIAYLTEECAIPPSRILAITFTNKAANEMKERIRSLINNQNFQYISTYHSFCVRFLREEIGLMNWPSNFSIIDEEDQKQIFKDAYKDLGVDKEQHSFGSILGYIARQKEAGINGKQSVTMAKKDRPDLLPKALMYERYEKILNGAFALDFDDLIIKTNEILATRPEIRNKWSRRFDYVMVDEFQDTSDIQYSIIKHLSKEKQNLCVVGDPDQTIFTWRGANIDLILNLTKDYPNLSTIILDNNYRSTQNILDGANSLIHQNKKRIKKDLFTRNDEGEKILRYQAKSADDEAKWVAKKINSLIKSGVNHREICIIYRSNYLSRQIEQSLVPEGIPYKVYGSFKFFQRKEIKDIIAFLRVMNNKDPIALERIINVPARAVGAVTLTRIKMFSEQNNMKLYDCLKNVDDIPGVPPRARNALSMLYANFEIYRNKTNTVPLANLITDFLTKVGYFTMLENDIDASRKENVKELMEYVNTFVETHDDEDNVLDKFLQEIAIHSAQDDLKDGRFISLMTIHISKGLEFEHVFIIGLNEGVFPSHHSINEGRIEEERRACYVAMTRAKKQLYISEASGFSFVTNNYRETSRFLNEIDPSTYDIATRKYSGVGDTSVFDSFFDTSKGPRKYAEEMYNDVEDGNPFQQDDIIVHKVFGEGVVLNTMDDTIEVLFGHPHKRKILQWNHKSIVRKKDFD